MHLCLCFRLQAHTQKIFCFCFWIFIFVNLIRNLHNLNYESIYFSFKRMLYYDGNVGCMISLYFKLKHVVINKINI